MITKSPTPTLMTVGQLVPDSGRAAAEVADGLGVPVERIVGVGVEVEVPGQVQSSLSRQLISRQ